MRASDPVWMNNMIVLADNVIATEAASPGLEISNLATVMVGFAQCTSTPGLNSIVGTGASETFHPNAFGHVLIASQIERTIAAPLEPTFSILPKQTVTKTFVVKG